MLILENEISSIYEADHILRRKNQVDSIAFERAKILLKNGSISLDEYEKLKKQMIQNELDRSLNRKSIEALRKTITDTKEGLAQKELELSDDLNVELIQIQDDLSQLYNHVDDLTYDRFIYSTEAGILGLVEFDRQMQVNEHDLLFTITPEGSNTLEGYVQIPQKGAAKVKKGNEVRIKLHAYPYLEYGAVIGYVQHISSLGNDEGYQAVVQFPDGLITNYDIKLDFLPNMEGQSEIIIKKENLLQNIVEVLKWNKEIHLGI